MHSFGQVWSADSSNDDILNLEEPIESFECSSHCANRHHPGHPWLASFQAGNQSPKLVQNNQRNLKIWLKFRTSGWRSWLAFKSESVAKTRVKNPLNLLDFSVAIFAGPGAFFGPGVCTCCWHCLACKP